MGFFDKFLGRPDRDQWVTIALNISKGFEKVRNLWFDECVYVLHGASICKIENSKLSGSAELAIKAYQLLLASSFIAGKSYIPLKEGNDFADILYSQICGTQLYECMAFFMRYYEVGEDGQQVHRFASDIGMYITYNETSINNEASFAAFIISSLVLRLIYLVHIVIAHSFGDDKTFKTLKLEIPTVPTALQSLEKMMQKIRQSLTDETHRTDLQSGATRQKGSCPKCGESVDEQWGFCSNCAEESNPYATVRNTAKENFPSNQEKSVETHNEITPEQWARFALDQLISEKWRMTLREILLNLRKVKVVTPQISENNLLCIMTAATLNLLAFTARHFNEKLMEVIIFLTVTEYLPKLHQTPFGKQVDEAYSYCNNKIAECGIKRIDGIRAIVEACAELIGLQNCSPSFLQNIEAEFVALGQTWKADAGQYKWKF